MIKILIEIQEDVEITQIKTIRKKIKEDKIEREVELLVFTLKGDNLGLTIQQEAINHPLRDLRHNGLSVEANISIVISNPQKSIVEFAEDNKK